MYRTRTEHGSRWSVAAASHTNWEGYDALRCEALKVPHWGNDEDYCDEIFADFYREYCRIVRAQNNFLGKSYDPSMLAISTPVPFGKVCEAFPDGRYRFESIADGVTSAFSGTDLNGPTVVIRSCCKIDHTEIRGGSLNLKLHPSAIKGENGSRNLLVLLKTYFSKNNNIREATLGVYHRLGQQKYADSGIGYQFEHDDIEHENECYMNICQIFNKEGFLCELL